MPAYYTFGKNLKNYQKLADDLWYASSGITVVTKTTFNVAIGLTDQPLVQSHDQFLHAMQQENHYEAAMLYEALIYLTEEATYIDHQLSKNFHTRSSARIPLPLADATEKAYDMVVYDVYPKSRAEFGARKNWYTLHAPRKSKILQPTEINKRTIEDMRHLLWATVSQTQPWGTRGYQRDVPEAKNRMKYLVSEAITNAEHAENLTKRGDLFNAAVAFTHATFMLNLYFQYRQSLSGKMAAKEFGEMDMVSENIFNSHYSAIKDMIGV